MPNVMIPGEGGLNMDPNVDMKQYISEQVREVRNCEEIGKTALNRMFTSDRFYFHAFFALALSPRCQKKVAQLEQSKQLLFAGKMQCRRAQLYTAGYRSNNPAVDSCMMSLLTLYEAEAGDRERSETLIELTRSTYPKLYNACMATGTSSDICTTYLRLLKINKNDKEALAGQPMSESLLVLCLLFWLFVALGKEPTLGDGLFAANVWKLVEEREHIYEYGDPPQLNADVTRHARKIMPFFKSKVVPCTQIVLNKYVRYDAVLYYFRLLEVAGIPLDVIRLLESVPVTEREIGLLLASEGGLCAPLEESVVSYLLIKSLALSGNDALTRLTDAEKELALLRQHVAAEQPVDEQITALRDELAGLERKLRETQGSLRTAANNERAANSQLASLRKTLEGRDAEIKRHQSDRRELAELREAVYDLATQGEAPEEQAASEDIEYPYTRLPDGIICFGGIEGWRHKMQERFPTVRFIPVDYRYDTGILRRAPCIWINPSYFSHKMYSRIIGDARTTGIDVHYFRSRNVDLSARLFIETMRGYCETMAQDG